MSLPLNPLRKRQPFRSALVARVRQEIANGTYDTAEKLEAAMERLFESLSNQSRHNEVTEKNATDGGW